jgi:membrane protease YdiL (CAAX protease family)
MTVAVRLFDGGPLRFLPEALREPRRAWLAILVGLVLTLGGSLILSWVANSLAPSLAKPEFPMKGLVAFGLLVVFAPVVETLIMAAVLSVLTRVLSPTAAVLGSSLLWGIAHSAQAAVWGLVIWWPFLIFSTLYLVWRQRSVLAGLAVAATCHALQNLVPAVVIAFGR